MPASARAVTRLRRLGTLRVRLTIAVALVAAAGLAAGAALLLRAVETTVVRAVEDRSRDELHRVGIRVAGGVPLKEAHLHVRRPEPVPGVPGVAAGFGAGPPPPCRHFTFIRPDGSRVDTPCADGPAIALPAPGLRHDPDAADLPPPPLAAPVTVPPPPFPLPPLPDPGERFAVVETTMMTPRDGPVRAFAVTPLADVLRSVETLRDILAIGVPILVVLLTLAAWILVGRALRPVRVMTQTAAGIADATASRRLAIPRARDELAELATTLNGMLDRLAGAARRQREFVSDASHELRSPIAATRAQIEVALAHPGRADHGAVLRNVLAETGRLEILVADLLALAQLDERPTPTLEELDLDDVVLDEAARPRAVPIDARGVTAVKIRGERKSLAHLVRNLLDNAARHATSRVELATTPDGTLTIDDDGPGIPDADRERVFERFTRLSPSRSRDDGGAGLGLALVRRVAEQHGATILVARSALGGARFAVRFPAIATAARAS